MEYFLAKKEIDFENIYGRTSNIFNGQVDNYICSKFGGANHGSFTSALHTVIHFVETPFLSSRDTKTGISTKIS